MKIFKVFFAMFLMMVMILPLAACVSDVADNSTSTVTTESTGTEKLDDTSDSADKNIEGSETMEPETNSGSTPNSKTGSDILVVYFSRTGEQYGVGLIDEGNTAIVAKMIAESTGADTFEILPVDNHYPMTYDELTDVARKEQGDKARLAYKSDQIPDLSKYKTIFIGAPVWWGDWPMICYTFFENEDLSGKTLYPFSTHAGSGLSGFDRKLASAVPDAKVGEGLAIAGTDCQNDKDKVRNKVNKWLSGLEY